MAKSRLNEIADEVDKQAKLPFKKKPASVLKETFPPKKSFNGPKKSF